MRCYCLLRSQCTHAGIEVKMFYGASTIAQDGRSAVGCVRGTARKYAAAHGSGAMVFMHGYGDRLAAELWADAGVMALDCGGSSPGDESIISLERVHAHQRTWCGDRDGNILP